MTSPPAAIQVMAGIILGPVGSAYGLVTGTDIVTGEELNGLDYVFNALDFIPGGSVLGDIGGSLIKKLDVVTSSKVLKIGDNLGLYKSYKTVIKGINTTLTGAEKLVKATEDLVVKVMAWSGNMVFDQGSKLIKLLSKNGQELGAIKGNKLNLSSSAVVTSPGGQTFKVGDDVEVYIDGEKKAEKYEMVKTEDGETGFRKRGEVDLNDAFKPGYTKEQIIAIPKGQRPDPSDYLNESYISNHLKKFDQEGASFIFTPEDIVNPAYKSFNPQKFVMLRSDMNEIVKNYKSNQSIEYLEESLGYNPGSLTGKEIYILTIEKPKVKMPSGNEGGANNKWEPGGFTSGGKHEAVLDDYLIEHNNSIENLPNVKPIMDY